MKSAIVTGATGFVGHWLIRALLAEHIPTTAVIREGRRLPPDWPESELLTVVECSMDHYSSLPERIPAQPGAVFFHLAWAGVSGTERSNAAIQLANVAASKAAVEAAAALGCATFVGLGTIMEQEAIAVTDTDGTKPGMGYLYGEAKHMAHLLTKAVAAQKGICHIWPMLTNAYGEYEYSPRFINSTLRKILHHEPLEFTAATQIYDFIHIEDTVKALIALEKSGQAGHSYVIGSGHAAPLRSFIETIGRTLAPDQPLLFGNVPFTGATLPAEYFSIDHLTTDTGFRPGISFADGICRTMRWIKEMEDH